MTDWLIERYNKRIEAALAARQRAEAQASQTFASEVAEAELELMTSIEHRGAIWGRSLKGPLGSEAELSEEPSEEPSAGGAAAEQFVSDINEVMERLKQEPSIEESPTHAPA